MTLGFGVFLEVCVILTTTELGNIPNISHETQK